MHVLGRLQIGAAGVEADAFTDEREQWPVGTPPWEVTHAQDPGIRLGAALGDGDKRPGAQSAQLFHVEEFRLPALLVR